MMMRIANMICRRKKLNAIVTGEAVGQVASQTIINLGTIDAAADFVMLRPLCGMDKLETIRRAEKLGTYELSIDPQPDSCTVFAPPSPSVAAKLFDIEREEAKLGDIQPLLEKAYEEMLIS
jgi:thiamine biosynthesis protein ThiI